MSKIDGFHSISGEIIAGMALEAAKNERKRVHLLLHSGHDDQVQRLLIVMQPGTYVRPHHHSLQWEMLILLKGGGELLARLLLGRAARQVSQQRRNLLIRQIDGPIRP